MTGLAPLVRAVIEARFAATLAFPTVGGVPPASYGIGWSDHWAFWEFGYPAMMLTDTAPFRYPHYHKPSDTPDKIDYARMARMVEGVERVVRDIARSKRAQGVGMAIRPGAGRIVALLLLALALTGSAIAQEAKPLYIREALRIAMPEAGAKGLEAVLVRPAAEGKYPLVLIDAARRASRRTGRHDAADVPSRRSWNLPGAAGPWRR